MARAVLIALAAAAAGGCGGPKPKAPPLTNDAVFQSDRAGLRFLVPEGWAVTSRADLPPGPLAKPVIVVAYKNPRGERAAELEVLAADLPEDADPGKFVAEHRVGPDRWAVTGPAEAVTVNGVPATRYVLAAGGKEPTRREVTVFRWGGRLFLFQITYAAADPASRDAARKAVESATWFGEP
jgi:hypothetical protein